MSKQKSFVKTFLYEKVPIRAHVIDGLHTVELQRTRADVLSGKKCDPERCMDANVMVRLSGSFPHKVMAVWVFKSTAYVLRSVDKRKGTYTVVRYLHSDGADIEKFDKGIKVEPIKKFVLHPPPKANKIGSGHWRDYAMTNGNRVDSAKRSRKWAPRGQNARFQSQRKWQEMCSIAQA